ncbi:T Cell Receptor Beta Variable 13 [Manis pentadactyla]|nr:T Cell Receptor Beta Variable 13 [Manis pentadactyla]
MAREVLTAGAPAAKSETQDTVSSGMHQAESHVLETKPESLALKNFQYPRHRRSQPHKVNAAAERVVKSRGLQAKIPWNHCRDRAGAQVVPRV